MNRLKVVLITQGISRLVNPLVYSEHEVVGILESMPRNYNQKNNKSFLLRCLIRLYCFFTKQDILLSDFCNRKNIPYEIISKENSAYVVKWIKNLKPDLIVIFSMSQLLDDDVLKIPRLGVVNLHPSFLPDYRGPNPDFWQYYDVEMNPGVTVHYVDLGEDTGDIIYQDRIYIPLGTKSPERMNKLIGEVGVPMVLKAIDAIAQDVAPRIHQPGQSSTLRARNLKPEEYLQIIDWNNWPIERVWHFLSGTELWLNAIPQPAGLLAGQRWSIQEYEKLDTPQELIGKLGKNKGRNCIFVKDGLIYVSIVFDVKKTILRILSC